MTIMDTLEVCIIVVIVNVWTVLVPFPCTHALSATNRSEQDKKKKD